MAARPRGADSKTGHQAGGGSCRTRASEKGPFRSGRLRKRANGGLPVAPQPHKPTASPLPQQGSPFLSISSQPMFGQAIRAQSWGPRTATSLMEAAASLLLSSINAIKNEERHGGGELRAQPGGLRLCWVEFACPSIWRDRRGQRTVRVGPLDYLDNLSGNE